MMKTVHELGLALSRKEFNAAADFCFLAANLLDSDYDCFEQQDFIQNDDEEPFRKHITLINASLPDDKYYSTQTSYGWSITDFQATEIYDFAIRMKHSPESSQGSDEYPLLQGSDEYRSLQGSDEYQKCRLEYAHLL
uniref:Ancestral coatomer element 1 Sec16/Sec31 domain-containing protein n=1 Tax=Panagrolaimus sp. JU765 TaxID=591449 RepID=A0AC34R5Y1_9BILA